VSFKQLSGVFITSVFLVLPAIGQQTPAASVAPESYRGAAVTAPTPQPGHISGTVTDSDNELVPDAQVVLEGPAPEAARTTVSNGDGVFSFDGLKPGVPYHVTISAQGFVPWTSPAIVLAPGQFKFLTGDKLAFAGGATSVTVSAASPAQIAVEQVKLEEQQRVLGFVPNFYVSYDHNAAPLTTKLKFKLALRADTDPVTFLGVAFVGALDQGGATPNYGGGMAGYGQRVGALYTNGFTDIMIGGAILPSLLHQDPRYFYQGTGTTRSRLLHALSAPFICKGDDGRWEPNYSSVGGDLASGAISNAYYPESNRGAGLVFENAAITTGGRMANGLVQEFLLRRLTPGARKQTY
jgi:Carboxypeptidase regulatory-like domain